MSKAIQGAVEIGVAVGIAAFAIATSGAGLAALPILAHELAPLIMLGVGNEIGALADALSTNRGAGITTRQPAQFRQIIYGTRRVGGTIVYVSSTGSHHDQYNMVIVLATHEVYAIQNLFLDGRQVYWNPNSRAGYTVRNGIAFGGGGDGQQHLGPNGVYYSFADGNSGHSGVYCQPYFGDQAPGTVDGGLLANDPAWGSSPSGQTPYLGGCAYAYLKLEYDTNEFPSFPPEIKFTVQGKQVYDPRTGTKVFSSNPALILADIAADPVYGLSLASNQDQLIAAANICDEQVPCAAGTEVRYACNISYDTSSQLGDVIQNVLNCMAGRISTIEGELYIFPGAYLAPTLSFGPGDLLDRFTWKPTPTNRELANRVRGTYTAANYPYNATSANGSNQYDSNGYYNGQTQNNFPLEWQPDDYPEYACDPDHGYAADQYLDQDGGRLNVMQLDLPAVLSISQAQRLAKIALLRARQWGSATLTMGLAALQLQPCDTFYMTFPFLGWNKKVLEVTSVSLELATGDGGQQHFVVKVGVCSTDPSVYDWNATSEEKSPYDVPAIPTQFPYTVAAPTGMTVTSQVGAQPDGTLVHQLLVQWNTPADTRVAQILCQYQVQGAATWIDGGTVSVQSNALMLNSIISGQTYNVRICSLRTNGSASTWVEADAIATNALSPTVTQGYGVAQDALSVSGTTVTIDPISTTLGSTPVSYYPNGATVPGFTPGVTNYVYLQDPTYSGGTPTPYVTTNRSDYLGKIGYVLLGSLN